MPSLGRIYRGVVKVFKPGQNQRYGFMDVAVGGCKKCSVFFHAVDHRGASERGEYEPVLVETSGFREPRPGDELVFYWTYGRKGPKAYHWAFADDWDAAAERIRVRNSTYRYSEVVVINGRPDEPGVVWEGRDLAELEDFIPARPDRPVHHVLGSDRQYYWPLYLLVEAPTHKLYGRFERLTVKGWEICLDPRIVTDLLTGRSR